MARDKKTTHKIMSAIKSKNTRPEVILGKAMWKLGIRYRKQYKIPGKPDFVCVSGKVAVFCDGDFWHGNNWRLRGLNSFDEELSGYSEFWQKKITRNVERDLQINSTLKKMGWKVFRFWESDIIENPDKCAKRVYKYIKKRSS
ncbi:MAG: very short patch repair endonuclease [Phycisphaerae bacterium]|nr:very short patch repair endonuclease [Phycisphaerae bacterium]